LSELADPLFDSGTAGRFPGSSEAGFVTGESFRSVREVPSPGLVFFVSLDLVGGAAGGGWRVVVFSGGGGASGCRPSFCTSCSRSLTRC